MATHSHTVRKGASHAAAVAAAAAVWVLLLAATGCATRPPCLQSLMQMSRQQPNQAADTLRNCLLTTQRPVVVFFRKTGCPACSLYAPTFYGVARDYEGKAMFVDADIHETMELTWQYQITGTPTVIVFKNGQEKERLVGTHLGMTLKKAIDAALE